MTFNTTEYYLAHGHQPRGEGNWAFTNQHDTLRAPVEMDRLFWFRGTYGDAKKAARVHFKGSPVVYVCS